MYVSSPRFKDLKSLPPPKRSALAAEGQTYLKLVEGGGGERYLKLGGGGSQTYLNLDRGGNAYVKLKKKTPN